MGSTLKGVISDLLRGHYRNLVNKCPSLCLTFIFVYEINTIIKVNTIQYVPKYNSNFLQLEVCMYSSFGKVNN